MKYKDYYNFELGNRDIYSHNDILGMTVKDLFDNELPLSYQYNTIGIPKDDELMASPNTHQYTNANGKLRWRSSSKTAEEFLEEERQRAQAQQAQTQAMQSQLGTMAGGAAPVNNVQEQTVESPMMESEPLLNDASIQALGGLIDKATDKFQANKEANDAAEAELHDLIFGSVEKNEEAVQNPFDPSSQESNSIQSQPISDKQDSLDEGLSDEEFAKIGQEISAKYKEAQKRVKENNSSSDAENSSDMLFDLNAQKTGWSQSLKNYLRNHSKTYRNYEGLTPKEAGQKWASKFLSPLTAREYYGLASELHDDEKPAKKRLRDNDFYKLDDIHNKETRQLIEKNIIQNLGLDPNDPATYEKLKDMDVVVPKTSSHLYKLVKDSDELADFVANNYEAMKTNSSKMVNGSFEYARPTKDKSNGGFWDKTNRYAIYKKSDVNAKMNPDGSISIIHPDTYDFDYMDPEKEEGWLNKGIAEANNRAFNQQEKGQIDKYSLTTLLTLTPEEIQELLERSKRRKNSK